MSVTLLHGCGFENNRRHDSNNQKHTIYSKDSLFSITLPKGWIEITDHSLNDDADLQAQKRLAMQYVVVLIDAKEDLDYTFEEWRKHVTDHSLDAMDNASISDGEEIVIDGQPAKQYEIQATSESVKIRLLATYIDGKNHFCQIVAFTSPSQYKSAVEEFNAITRSIKGL
ncbi:MAG: hypothetical protein FWF72_02900 [Paludibacter sp.]|nr:hypothetical protein [Paludibacter sp.]